MSVVLATQNLRADGDITEIGGVDNMNVTEIEAIQLLTQILTALKKIEYHLSIATDTNLNDQDI
jgi:diketogulonate reductase-like aldo/keto reductase